MYSPFATPKGRGVAPRMGTVSPHFPIRITGYTSAPGPYDGD